MDGNTVKSKGVGTPVQWDTGWGPWGWIRGLAQRVHVGELQSAWAGLQSPSLQVGLRGPSRERESVCRSNQGTICNSYVWLLIVFFDRLRVSDAWLGLGVHWGKEL